MNIDSKLHYMEDLVRSGRLAEPSYDNANTARVVKDAAEILRAARFFDRAKSLPRFVFTRDIVSMAVTKDSVQSMTDMVEADVLHLPFPEIVVEIVNPNEKDFYLVIVKEEANSSVFVSEIAATTLRAVEPFVMVMNLTIRGSLSKGADGKLVFESDCHGATGLVDNDTLIRPYLRANQVAVSCATVMLQTLGLRRETVSEPRLSRARVARGKSPVHPYTRVSIGRVYHHDEHEDSEEYVPGKSPRPHWRRGHSRRYHYGPGRTGGTRVRWIPARMVSVATAPEYRVSK